MAGQIQPGAAFPDVKVFILENDKPKGVQTAEIFKGKKVKYTDPSTIIFVGIFSCVVN